MSLTYNKNKSGPNKDPWGTPQVRFPGSENFLSILTLKVLPDKYDSNHITFSENPMHPNFFKEVFHDLLCQKLLVSQLNPCTSQIQNLCSFCQLIMLNKSSLKMIFETLIDIYIKFYSCLRKFRFDYE